MISVTLIITSAILLLGPATPPLPEKTVIVQSYRITEEPDPVVPGDRPMSELKVPQPESLSLDQLDKIQPSFNEFNSPVPQQNQALPDIDATPHINSSGKKRRFQTEDSYEARDVVLNTERARQFKKVLEEMIEQDGMKIGKSDMMKVHYHPNYLVINNDSLRGHLFNRYRNLLFEYGIDPAENRHIYSDKKYLMAGDFKDGQFRGTVLGRLMKVRSRSVPGKLNGKPARMYITDIEPVDEKYKEATFIDYDGTPPKSSFNAPTDSVISREKLRLLHQSLIDLFDSLNMDTKRNFEYSITFESNDIRLKQRRLNTQNKQRLIQLLEKHEVRLKDDRLLLMNQNGIVIVDKMAPKRNFINVWASEGKMFQILASDNLNEVERHFFRKN